MAASGSSMLTDSHPALRCFNDFVSKKEYITSIKNEEERSEAVCGLRQGQIVLHIVRLGGTRGGATVGWALEGRSTFGPGPL